MFKKYCQLDEKGDVKSQDDKVVFKSSEDVGNFTKEVNDLLDVDFECESIKLSEIENVKDLKGLFVAGVMPLIEEC